MVRACKADEDGLKEWKKKHTKLMKAAADAGEDQEMKAFNAFSPCCTKEHRVTPVMAENRLSQPLRAASAGQKAAYAKKHGYSFCLLQSGRFVFDETRTNKVHDVVIKVQ